MHLSEFILLILATVAAVAAGLAMIASKYSIARACFWVAAISFWSMGILWSATSNEYSLRTQVIVSAIVGGIAAGALAWVLWEIRGKEAEETPASLNENLRSLKPSEVLSGAQSAPSPPAAPKDQPHPAIVRVGPAGTIDNLNMINNNINGDVDVVGNEGKIGNATLKDNVVNNPAKPNDIKNGRDHNAKKH